MSAPKLVDRVLAWDGLPDELREKLQERPPAFLATNVAQYYAVGTDKEHWHESRDFPNVAPPFETFWLEWDAPTLYVSEVNGHVPVPEMQGAKVGALVMALELGDAAEREARRVEARAQEKFIAIDFQVPSVNPGMKTANAPLDSRWMCMAYLFQYIPQVAELTEEPDEPSLLGAVFWFAAEDGSYRGEYIQPGVQGGMSGIIPVDTVLQLRVSEMLREVDFTRNDYLGMMRVVFHPGLLTISFLHCRNVERRLLPPAPTPRRAKPNRHKPPRSGVRFHVLEVEPLKAILRREAGAKTDLKQALHICRGHFKTYGGPMLDADGKPILDETGKPRERAGLFGRLKGTYWWGDQTRGSPSRGRIEKDYDVGAPESESA